MKVILLKENFKKGLLVVGKSPTTNLSLPILKNILIKTDTKIQLTATDLEIAITHFLSGKIIEAGGITIPINTITEIINNLKNEKINLEIKNKNLFIKTDNYEALLQGINEEEFPIIPKIKNTKNFIEVNSKSLADSFESVILAAPTSDIRPEIFGVLFNFELGSIKLTTTDSFRLAEKSITQDQFKTNIESGFKIIIPLKTIDNLIRIIRQIQIETVKIYLDQNQILFCIEDTEIISRLIGGTYPDYQQIIPKEIKTKIVCNNQELINALKISSAFVSRSNEIKITANKEKGLLEIFSQDSSLGENRYTLPAKIGGPTHAASFNWKYLLDGLRSIKDEDLILGISDGPGEVKPAIIKPAKDTSFFYILMPIKTS